MIKIKAGCDGYIYAIAIIENSRCKYFLSGELKKDYSGVIELLKDVIYPEYKAMLDNATVKDNGSKDGIIRKMIEIP